jgi:hypothetical protein
MLARGRTLSLDCRRKDERKTLHVTSLAEVQGFPFSRKPERLEDHALAEGCRCSVRNRHVRSYLTAFRMPMGLRFVRNFPNLFQGLKLFVDAQVIPRLLDEGSLSRT